MTAASPIRAARFKACRAIARGSGTRSLRIDAGSWNREKQGDVHS
jgi:hypothetical protein